MNIKIALETDGYDVEGGEFVFPNYRFGFQFKKNMMCQAVFDQKESSHVTLKPNEPTNFSKLGLSMQISSGITQKLKKLADGEYEDEKYFISDSKHIFHNLCK